MYCKNCNAALNEGDKFCTQCGTPNIAAPAPAPQAEPIFAPPPPFEPVVQEAYTPQPEPVFVPQSEPVFVPQSEPVFAPQPEPVFAPQPEPVFAPQPEPVFAPQPEPVFAPQPKPVFVPQPEPAVPPVYTSAPKKQEAPAPEAKNSRIDAPLSTWGFMWRSFVFSIPVIGIVFLFVFAFASGINKNSKHYASSMIIWGLIGIGLCIATIALLFAFGIDKKIVELVNQVIPLIEQTN